MFLYVCKKQQCIKVVVCVCAQGKIENRQTMSILPFQAVDLDLIQDPYCVVTQGLRESGSWVWNQLDEEEIIIPIVDKAELENASCVLVTTGSPDMFYEIPRLIIPEYLCLQTVLQNHRKSQRAEMDELIFLFPMRLIRRVIPPPTGRNRKGVKRKRTDVSLPFIILQRNTSFLPFREHKEQRRSFLL